jgi:UDP-2-acetamido-2,6-beta-L-arabino-hexul-4-ose reductase
MKPELKKLKKQTDERGWLVEILRADEVKEEMKQIYFSTSKPNAIRGNHYHKHKVEWFSVVKGKAKLVLEDNESKEREELILLDDTPAIVKIPPNISHAIQNIGDDEMYLIVIVNEVFNPDDADTFYVSLI